MHCWARTLLYVVIAALAFAQMMVACGQKGDLFLPPDEPAAAAPPTPAPVPDADDEDLRALDDVPEVPPGPDAD